MYCDPSIDNNNQEDQELIKNNISNSPKNSNKKLKTKEGAMAQKPQPYSFGIKKLSINSCRNTLKGFMKS